MEKMDLFQTLVRFLAVKPLKFEKFDLDQAKSIIKKEREGAVTFIGDHNYFEQVVEETAAKVGSLGIKNGTVYLYVVGQGCTERMRRNILEIIMSVHSIIIFGDAAKWPIKDPKIKFASPEGLFADNHQRFFIYQSSSYNVALVARHAEKNGNVVIEAAMTNASDAVALISQTVGTKIYQQNQ